MKTQNLPQIHVPLITRVGQGKTGKSKRYHNHGLDEIEIIHVQKKSLPDNSNLQGK